LKQRMVKNVVRTAV